MEHIRECQVKLRSVGSLFANKYVKEYKIMSLKIADGLFKGLKTQANADMCDKAGIDSLPFLKSNWEILE